MEIHNLKVVKDKGFSELRVSCTIKGKTKECYIRVAEKYKHFIVEDMTPFAAAFLPVSMSLGEDLYVKGKVSEKCYEGMLKIMSILESWNVGLKKISIVIDQLDRDTYEPKYSASFFSGGVDSFFTLVRNTKLITHIILVHGFDVELENRLLRKLTCEHTQEISKYFHKELILVETNLKKITEPLVKWDWSHGGALALVFLTLRRGFSEVYIASSYSNNQLFPWGSHPEIDKNWSTESTKVIHDGNDTTRTQKVAYIAEKSEFALNHLRVCGTNLVNKYNCGKCDKCLRTMLNLKLANALNKTKTFPHDIDLEELKKVRIHDEHGAVFYREILDGLSNQGDNELLINIIQSKLKNLVKAPSLIHKIIFFIEKLDMKYNRRRLYTYIFSINNRSDRNLIYKILNILHAI